MSEPECVVRAQKKCPMFTNPAMFFQLDWRLFSLACNVKVFTNFLDLSNSTAAGEEQIYTCVCYVLCMLSSV